MKKYILFLLTILVVLGTTLITNMMLVNDNINKTFDNAGYILKNSDDSERYYFNQESTYKNSYNDQIVFNDTEGEKIVINKYNFIHYEDGSISSFTKGVLLDLDTIDTEPITYYNISGNKVLKKLSNNKYVTKNLEKELQFGNFMWRISQNKYLVAGNSITIQFADGTEKQITGFLEIEYSDNEIVNIFNQEVNYETISSEVYLKISDNVKINLGTKIVSKNDVNEMTLENMVIDSNDNITIIDMDEYKEEEKDEENENTTKGDSSFTSSDSTGGSVSGIQGGNAGSVSGGDSIANGGTTIVGGTTENNGSSEGKDEDDGNNDNNTDNNGGTIGGDVEVEVQDDLSVYAPKYTVKEFEVSATGVKAKVEIEDDEARLTTGTFTYILDNSTGKIVYPSDQTPVEDKKTEITLDTSSLQPDTEYTLVMEASYSVENTDYKKNFVYKIFRTKGLGIILEKDMFTAETLAFNIKFEKESPVTKLDVELVENGQVRSEIINNNGNATKIEFAELTPDTEYTIRIKNIYVGNITNPNTYSYKYKTLKQAPKINGESDYTDLQVEIDKRNSKFVLSIPGLEEGMVETLNYQIFTVTEDVKTLVHSKITSAKKVSLSVGENEKLQRNTDYICRVIATFYDNEKTVEYEIANSLSSFSLNSSEMPTVRFETGSEGSVTGNSIKGTLIIDDPGNTIDSDTTKIDIMYNSTTKDVNDNGTISIEGIADDLRIPFEIKGLKSLETYKLSVYGTYDLNDDNGERYGYIGSIMITTRKHDAIKAVWTAGDEGVDARLALAKTGNSNNELMSLYSFDIELYGGQPGAGGAKLGKTYKAIDNGENGKFVSSLNAEYGLTDGNSGKMLTGSDFGLNAGDIEKIKKDYTWCTIMIKNAKAIDYTKHKNEISIETASLVYLTKDIELDNPSDSYNAIKVEQVRKQILGTEINRETVKQIVSTNGYTVNQETKEITKPENYNLINDSTIVAYKTTANLSETQLNQLFDGGYKYFKYFVYIDGKDNPIVTSDLIEWTSKTAAPTAMFLISNGTNYKNNDAELDYLVRGNKYYFTYEIYTDTVAAAVYPSVGYWNSNDKPNVNTNKQEANVIMYPSTSDDDSITYKYKIADIDNAIDVDSEGVKRFYQFYASIAEFEHNPKPIRFGNNKEDPNGYYSVKFDQLSSKFKNYNLEIKILHSISKSEPPTYRTLATQKLEEIIQLDNLKMYLTEKKGIGVEISFGNLSDPQKARLAQIEIELIDKETDPNKKIENIVITKSKKELEYNNNWKIDINYLEQIYKKNVSLKDKEFSVKAKIYYANGVVGYDNQDDAVAYQKINGEWLKIYNKRFETSDNSNMVAYKSHAYNFEDDVMLIKNSENQEEISGLNYSDKGFTTNMNGENIVVLAKKVKVHEINGQSIEFLDVIPGFYIGNIKCTTGPTNAIIELDRIYAKDTIYTKTNDNDISDVYVELYDSKETEVPINTIQFNDDTHKAEFTELTQGKEYYYRLYVMYNGEKAYLYDRSNNSNTLIYSCETINNVVIENLNIEYDSKNEKIEITHTADILSGYYGFEYNIYDANGEAVFEEPKRIRLEDFNGQVNISTNSENGEFNEYEFGQVYKIKVTPIIYNKDKDEYEATIGTRKRT